MLTRKKPLTRTRMKRRPTKVKPGSDPKRLAFVRTLPCCLSEVFYDATPEEIATGRWSLASFCIGPNEAHHPIGLKHGKAMSTKAPDALAIPLCRIHHSQFHNLGGPFYGLTGQRRQEWQDYHVERVTRIPTP